MKILYHHRTRSKDGQFVHISEMIHALREQGHEVIVVAPPAGANEQFGADAGLVGTLKRLLPRFIYELMEFAYSFVAYRRLRQALIEHKPDCLYERYNLFLPAGVWLKRRYGLPMLLEVNAPLYEERRTYEGIALERFARWSERYAWCGADFVLPVTGVLAGHVERAGVAREKIVVIPNGINRAHFNAHVDTEQAKRKLGLEGRLVLGFTGFIRAWHGLERVVELIAKPGADAARHLLIVGDGPARVAVERRAVELGVADRVTVTGIVQRDRVPDYLAAFDVALQPAVVAYASPLKLIEYLAMGRAIVAPASPNILEVLSDGENAVLFDPDQAEGMVVAIDRICNDAGLRRRVAEGARNTIELRKLTWDNNAQSVVGLFERLLKNRVPSPRPPPH
jgi:glycosyltransferase involved in cell wall biosynthesis